ncbi:DUF554 domain-containing protein [Atopobacter sp. AH10]|uniref:DUF554 domain-containing protein n=1 Tax=Atopobacter sp. AH10 TaxID=2315861 RepID=UPI00131406A0|nr:DUF554 domain-containing protein [Atopobacter sp. AH10]
MIFLGTIVDCLSVLLMGFAGRFFGHLLTESMKKIGMQSIALVVIYYGIKEAMTTKSLLVLILSLMIGGLLGELCKLDQKIEIFSQWFGHLMSKTTKSSNFSQGFVSMTMISCIGAMTIIGAFQSGIDGKHSILLSKAIMDGLVAFIMGSSMGLSVSCASLPLLIYEGGFTLLAFLLKGSLSPEVVTEISAVGSLLILGLGLNVLEVTHIKMASFLPAPFIPMILVPILQSLK